MKIVVAMDSFKGSLSAAEACGAVRRGLREADAALDVRTAPLADGGEGTAETLLVASVAQRGLQISALSRLLMWPTRQYP